MKQDTRTFIETKAELNALGITLTRKVATNEYIVNYAHGSEATRYYTDDLTDALATGIAMARQKAGGRW